MSDTGRQLTRGDLQSMTPEEIVRAYREGRVADVIAGKEPEPDTGELTLRDLAKLSEPTLRRLERDGKIDDILEGRSLVEAGLVPPPGDADLGARGDPHKPRQLTRSDLQSMTPEQRVKARKDGRLVEHLGIAP